MEKENLKDYMRLQQEVEDLQENIEKLRIQAHGIGAARLSAVPTPSGPSDKIAANMVRLESLVENYMKKMEQKLEQQREIEQAIEQLSGTERVLMRYRYIDGLSWVDVAARMHYSWKQTHRIHVRALEKLKDDTSGHVKT